MERSLSGPLGAPGAYINRIGTAVPPNDVHQAFIDFAQSLLPDRRTRQLFGRMAERAGIAHRYSHLRPNPPHAPCLDDSGFYRRGAFPGTAARMRLYEELATGLALQAIDGLAIEPAEITHLIVASCTGFSAPGLDQMIQCRLGLPGSVERTLIGFMGCYAAVPAFRAARHIVRSEPDARVLVVNLELCTLHLQETAELETVLSFLLFGDAASASLVTAEPYGIALEKFRAATLPGTAGLITWRIGDLGFDMHLSGQVPPAIAAALRAERARNDGAGVLGRQPARDVAHWAVHAGGRTVLDAVEQAFELPAAALSHARSVLRDVGNVSSATLPFVLSRLLSRDAKGPGLAMAFGPGLAAETFQFTLL
ncbi:MAG: type III polyketide synthase [Acetobacteraceae bacterium]|nr:type III polyketide synthase [Acetobacteraceae bacterium]